MVAEALLYSQWIADLKKQMHMPSFIQLLNTWELARETAFYPDIPDV
jgi:hypothetical protein